MRSRTSEAAGWKPICHGCAPSGRAGGAVSASAARGRATIDREGAGRVAARRISRYHEATGAGESAPHTPALTRPEESTPMTEPRIVRAPATATLWACLSLLLLAPVACAQAPA